MITQMAENAFMLFKLVLCFFGIIIIIYISVVAIWAIIDGFKERKIRNSVIRLDNNQQEQVEKLLKDMLNDKYEDK